MKMGSLANLHMWHSKSLAKTADHQLARLLHKNHARDVGGWFGVLDPSQVEAPSLHH